MMEEVMEFSYCFVKRSWIVRRIFEKIVSATLRMEGEKPMICIAQSETIVTRDSLLLNKGIAPFDGSLLRSLLK